MSSGHLFRWNGADTWVQKADAIEPGTLVGISSMIVFNQRLYAGATGDGNNWWNPYLLEWNGVDAWVRVVSFTIGQQETGIPSMAIFNGHLYGGGSSTGRLFVWDPDLGYWDQRASRYGSEQIISALIEFNGKLYGGSSFSGYLLEWNESNAWVLKAGTITGAIRISCFAVFGGELYAGTGDSCKLLKWNGSDAWVEMAGQYASEQVISALVEYQGKLYGCTRVWGTPVGGYLLEWSGSAWVEKAAAGESLVAMVVYKGYLYAASVLGKLYRWDGDSSWVLVAAQLNYEGGSKLIVFEQ